MLTWMEVASKYLKSLDIGADLVHDLTERFKRIHVADSEWFSMRFGCCC
jgi:hypothetical protein